MLIPDLGAGCSLAESITAEDVRLLRRAYPGVPVVTYVNTSAAVKAESDICCTSGNAKAVVESLGVPHVIMLPDEFLAHNIAAQTNVKIISWTGHCEVHERFTAAEVRELREDYPGRRRAGASRMPARGCRRSRFFRLDGGDAGLCRAPSAGARLVLLTECSMSDNVAVQYPELEFVRPCNLCPHMKKITLGNIRRALETMQHEVDDRSRASRRRRGARSNACWR